MAKHSLGTRLKMGLNYIAELTEISGVDMSADTLDITTLDVTDGYRRFSGGLKDGGEVGITGFFDPDDTLGQQALITAFDSGVESAFVIEFPASLGSSWTFNGVVTGVVTGAALEDPVSFEATIKISGKPTLGTTI